MLLNFAEDQDISAPETMALALWDLGLDGDLLIEMAKEDENKLQLRQQTEEAHARGVFGAPTFFVNGQMYWGNDRLEDALEDLGNESTAPADESASR